MQSAVLLRMADCFCFTGMYRWASAPSPGGCRMTAAGAFAFNAKVRITADAVMRKGAVADRQHSLNVQLFFFS